MTHGISFLSHVDEIIVITNGVISEHGTYQELLSHNGPFAELISSYLTEASVEFEDEGGDGLTIILLVDHSFWLLCRQNVLRSLGS